MKSRIWTALAVGGALWSTPALLFSQAASGLPAESSGQAGPSNPNASRLPVYRSVKEAYDAGIRAVKARRLGDALGAFQAAYALTTDPRTRAGIQKWIVYVKRQIPAPPTIPAAAGHAAPAPRDTSAITSPWMLTLASGADAPVSAWQPGYGPGELWGVSLMARVADGLFMGLDFHFAQFTGNNYVGNITDTEFRLLPEVQFHFDLGGGIHPYLLAGAGYTMEELQAPGPGDASAPPSTETDFNPDLAFGGGVGIGLSTATDLFIGGKINCIITKQATGFDAPLMGGLRFGL